jgi:hypothetical protein
VGPPRHGGQLRASPKRALLAPEPGREAAMPTQGDDLHYLHKCLKDFPEICRNKYGEGFDLAAVEKKVKRLRRKTELTYSDIRFFESSEHWWFKRFWIFPPESRVAPALKGIKFDFWNLSEADEAGLIRQLLHIFKSIDLVSIILRFIRPDGYAIISSPVQRILDIRRGHEPVETYVNYLSDLREIRTHYGFRRVADVDMALWALHEKCFGIHRDPEIEKCFHEDTFLLRLRAKNLVAPLAELSDAQLANALVDARPDLAALIACHALEMMIRRLAKGYRLPSSGYGVTLDQIIDSLPNFGPANTVRKGKWKMLKNARNDLVHCGIMPGPRERAILIEEVLQLEKDLEKEVIEKRLPEHA